ncbi:GAF domain-containing protein [Paenibacillus psychroresistens]|uniref:GAF domain-containing protein n=1 Tax=Paenibacillus psychroresistens TaxID=1778678 RepID=A0A6B8RM84_9BACL|nr:GAF domain-containing SpoIIE family protein phosphatase [Paenibacillus psychroresistens]QGQ96653.1 GAF domain-containing protein [Paenibacillus psychroresistens]
MLYLICILFCATLIPLTLYILKNNEKNRELTRTKILFEVSLQLNSTIKKKELLQIIMSTTAKVLNAEASSIILVDKVKGELYFEIATGAKENEIKEIRLKIGEGIAGWVAQTGESIRIDNASSDARWSNKVSSKLDFPTKNLLCVPVRSRGEIIGVLQVLNKQRGAHFNAMDLQLLEMIASPAASALENAQLFEALEESILSLKETTAVKERMERELQIAQEIQMSFLPQKQFVSTSAAELESYLKPAKVVGGDFYNYFYIDEDRLFMTLGDVSDKGIPAALFMAVAMTLIKGTMHAEMEPADLLYSVNNGLCKDDSNMFATIFCGILNIRTGHFIYSDGGHCTPYIIRNTGEIEPLAVIKSLPLGAFPDVSYHNQETMLQTGDTIFVYSDGITEAENAAQKQFGTTRLLQSLANGQTITLQALLQQLIIQVEAFVDGAPQFDDTALLMARFSANS